MYGSSFLIVGVTRGHLSSLCKEKAGPALGENRYQFRKVFFIYNINKIDLDLIAF